MRSPIVVRADAAEISDWIPLDRHPQVFTVGLGVKFSSGASATVSVQHTFDDLWREYTDFSISRTTTVATVTQVNHGLSVGDWVMVKNAGAPLDGQFKVATVADADTFTYTVANSGATSGAGNRRLQKARVFSHLTLAGITASSDGDYTAPVVACRLNCTTYSSGFVELNILQTR